MRTLFLLTAVVAFAAADAQQAELFDVSKHLQQRKKGATISFPSYLQQNSLQNRSQHLPLQQQSYTLPNGDKVATSPGYRMPIISTEINRYKTMPNPGEDYFVKEFYVPGQPKFNDIPNGAAELPLPKKLADLLKNKSR